MDLSAALLEALRFEHPRTERLRGVRDSEWELMLADWRVVRLLLPLAQARAECLPGWVRARVELCLADNAARFERITETYRTVARALDRAGAEHVVLKGFSLFPGYAEHPRFRPQSDIDLYCPPHSIELARNTLLELGYQALPWGHHLAQDHLPVLAPRSDWTWRGNFFDPDIPICFELHFCWWDAESTRIRPENIGEFWSRRMERRLDGTTFEALHPADNLGYTALNLLRDLLRGSVAADQAYGLARFLDSSAEDASFWQSWKSLHHASLRRLEAVSFLLAERAFASRLSDQAREEVDRLPPGVARWFDEFPKSVFTPAAHRKKDSLWLHLQLIESRSDKTAALFRRLLAVPKQLPTFETVLTKPSGSAVPGQPRGSTGFSNFCRKSLQYTAWAASRAVHHLGLIPVVLVRGASYGMAGARLGSGFWTFFAASLCFDFGMTMFFFLYNLFLLDRGYKEDFLGIMTSAMNIGSLAMTIPAGILIHRLGLRKALIFCLLLAPGVFAVRALVESRSALLWLALPAGAATTIWAVAISPAIARLTDDRNRARGFSVVFSSGIGAGVLANLVASRMPGWFAQWRPAIRGAEAKQLTLLVACAIVAAGVIPLSRVRFAQLPPGKRNLYPRNPFLWRFLPALALWSLVTGSLSPLSNVYFSEYLRAPLERMGVIFSLSQLCQVAGVLLAPLLFRRLGLVPGIASTQWITALFLLFLAGTSAPFTAASIYVAYSGFLWMSEPGLFTLLMERVSPAEQPGASSLNFFVITLSQAVAVGLTGSGFARFGYPAVLALMAAVAGVAASSFWLLLGREFPSARKAETAVLNG